MRTLILLIAASCLVSCGKSQDGGPPGRSQTYCSARGPLTEAEAADAGDLIPCPLGAQCLRIGGIGGGGLPDGAPVPATPGWACVIETGCASPDGDAGAHCSD
jgi:hypothetical protein